MCTWRTWVFVRERKKTRSVFVLSAASLLSSPPGWPALLQNPFSTLEIQLIQPCFSSIQHKCSTGSLCLTASSEHSRWCLSAGQIHAKSIDLGGQGLIPVFLLKCRGIHWLNIPAQVLLRSSSYISFFLCFPLNVFLLKICSKLTAYEASKVRTSLGSINTVYWKTVISVRQLFFMRRWNIQSRLWHEYIRWKKIASIFKMFWLHFLVIFEVPMVAVVCLRCGRCPALSLCPPPCSLWVM